MAKHPPPRPPCDHQLVQIVDAALADAIARSGPHLACRSGCTQCCIGVFAINQLDAARLHEGLLQLEKSDPARAAAVRQRASASLEKLRPTFPGKSSGLLGRSASEHLRFEDFANDEPCPALDPTTGLCDLYSHRPMTCRVFGPPVRTPDGIGVCELCFKGATQQEIESCLMDPDPEDLESRLLKEMNSRGETIVAFVLAQPKSR